MTLFLAAVWLFYVGGAAAGTLSFLSWGLWALFVAVGLLLIGFAADQIWPLSPSGKSKSSRSAERRPSFFVDPERKAKCAIN